MLICERTTQLNRFGDTVKYRVNIDVENPIIIFDSDFNEFVNYSELPYDMQNMIDGDIDYMEEGLWCELKDLGYHTYETVKAGRFELMRRIEGIHD